jgi:ABC-2 type transport system permease protein
MWMARDDAQRAPVPGRRDGWILNLAVWLAIFVAGAAWRLRRDTARV